MSGYYVEYKKYTDSFIDWITSASVAVNKTAKKLPPTINALTKRVDIIVHDAASIPKLCGKQQHLAALPNALFAGSRAIGLRLRVAELYAKGMRKGSTKDSHDDAVMREQNATHMYFIDRLKECHARLSEWHNTAVLWANEILSDGGSTDDAGSATQSSSFIASCPESFVGTNHNRYEILSDDDLHVMEEIISGGAGAGGRGGNHESGATLSNDQERAKVAAVAEATKIQDVDQALGELKVVIICFMMDLLDAMQQIEKIWKRVKKDELPILTAVAMTSVALQSMDEIYANMQLQYPSIKVASDLLMSDAGLFISAENIGKCDLSAFHGQLLLHYRVMCYFRDQVLVPYEKRLPPMDDKDEMVVRMQYDRNREGVPVLIEYHQLLPMKEPAIRNFFCTEFTNIFNKYNLNRVNLQGLFHSFPIMKDFLMEFFDFFATKRITVPALFRCICWLNIVSILQSKKHLTLGRTVYMARLHSRKYMDCVKYDDPVLEDLVAAMESLGLDVNERFSEHNFDLAEYELYHVNPYLAGAHALDMLCSSAYTTGAFKVSGQICILYTALRQEGILKEDIAFLDDFIAIFKTHIFGHDAQPPVRGKYFSTSALKWNFSAESIRFMNGFRPNNFGRFGDISSTLNRRRVNNELNSMFIPLSHVAGWLSKKNMSSAAFSTNLGLQGTLEMMEKLVTFELYGSKLLNLHSAKSMRLFNSFCARIISKFPFLSEDIQYIQPINHYGTVATLLCSKLCLTTLKYLDSSDRSDSMMHARCDVLAKEMKSFFLPLHLEKTLCTFPISPLHRRDVFGSIVPGDVQIDLNKMPEHSFDLDNENLSAYFLADAFAGEIEEIGSIQPGDEKERRKEMTITDLKNEITDNPLILQFVFEDTREFPSLLDYALCGSIQDPDLAEWIIQMKGLSLRGLQLTRISLGHGAGKKITSKSHLQISCQHRNSWAIRLIHAATQAIDIGFCPRDDPTGDAALHYCCRYGDMEHIGLLDHGQICFPNASGKLPLELLPPAELAKLGAFTILPEDEVRKIHQRNFTVAQAQGHKIEQGARLRAARVSKQLKKQSKDAKPVVTDADIKRAAEAEKALLDMLEQEDAAGTKAKKRSGGKKKKK